MFNGAWLHFAGLYRATRKKSGFRKWQNLAVNHILSLELGFVNALRIPEMVCDAPER